MIGVIFKKELKRVFTDKRLILSMFIIPAISIFAVYAFMGKLMSNMIDDVKEHIGIVYVQNAPEEFKTLSNNFADKYNINFIDGNDNVNETKENIKNGTVDLLIEFEEDFMAKIANYKDYPFPPQVKTFFNPSEDYSNEARNTFINTVLSTFQMGLLEQRFGNINHVSAFLIDSDNNESVIQDETKATGKGLGFIVPMMITIMLFAGAMSIGMDSIAGEKERGTMATLLLTPVDRTTIALGKVVSLGVVSIMSAVSSFIGLMAAIPLSAGMLSMGEQVSFSSLNYNAWDFIQLFLIMISMTGVFIGLICFVSILAKNVKEAGSYVSPIYILIMFASYANMFSDTSAKIYMYMIPVYNSTLAIKAILERNLQLNQFLITFFSSLAITAILIGLIAKAFDNEKIMLNA